MQTVLFQGQTVSGAQQARGQARRFEDSATNGEGFGALFATTAPSGVATASDVSGEVIDGSSSEQPATKALTQSAPSGQLESREPSEIPGPETAISPLPGAPTPGQGNEQEIYPSVFFEKGSTGNLAGYVGENTDPPRQRHASDSGRDGFDELPYPRIERSTSEPIDNAAGRKDQALQVPQHGDQVGPWANTSILDAESQVTIAQRHGRVSVATEMPKPTEDRWAGIANLAGGLAQARRLTPQKTGASAMEPFHRVTVSHPLQLDQKPSETPGSLMGPQVSEQAPTFAVDIVPFAAPVARRQTSPLGSPGLPTDAAGDMPDMIQSATENGATRYLNAAGAPAILSWPTDLPASLDPENLVAFAEFDSNANATLVHSDSTRFVGPAAPFDSALARPETARYIAAQMATALSAQPGNATEITLNPEELGRVRMVLSTSENGVSVSITTERPETIDLMRRYIDQLATEFRRLGYDDVGFDFSGGTAGGFGQENTNNQLVATSDFDSPGPETENTNRAMAPGGLDLRL